jgi:hypothetical protein
MHQQPPPRPHHRQPSSGRRPLTTGRQAGLATPKASARRTHASTATTCSVDEKTGRQEEQSPQRRCEQTRRWSSTTPTPLRRTPANRAAVGSTRTAPHILSTHIQQHRATPQQHRNGAPTNKRQTHTPTVPSPTCQLPTFAAMEGQSEFERYSAAVAAAPHNFASWDYLLSLVDSQVTSPADTRAGRHRVPLSMSSSRLRHVSVAPRPFAARCFRAPRMSSAGVYSSVRCDCASSGMERCCGCAWRGLR